MPEREGRVRIVLDFVQGSIAGIRRGIQHLHELLRLQREVSSMPVVVSFRAETGQVSRAFEGLRNQLEAFTEETGRSSRVLRNMFQQASLSLREFANEIGTLSRRFDFLRASAQAVGHELGRALGGIDVPLRRFVDLRKEMMQTGETANVFSRQLRRAFYAPLPEFFPLQAFRIRGLQLKKPEHIEYFRRFYQGYLDALAKEGKEAERRAIKVIEDFLNVLELILPGREVRKLRPWARGLGKVPPALMKGTLAEQWLYKIGTMPWKAIPELEKILEEYAFRKPPAEVRGLIDRWLRAGIPERVIGTVLKRLTTAGVRGEFPSLAITYREVLSQFGKVGEVPTAKFFDRFIRTVMEDEEKWEQLMKLLGGRKGTFVSPYLRQRPWAKRLMAITEILDAYRDYVRQIEQANEEVMKENQRSREIFESLREMIPGPYIGMIPTRKPVMRPTEMPLPFTQWLSQLPTRLKELEKALKEASTLKVRQAIEEQIKKMKELQKALEDAGLFLPTIKDSGVFLEELNKSIEVLGTKRQRLMASAQHLVNMAGSLETMASKLRIHLIPALENLGVNVRPLGEVTKVSRVQWQEVYQGDIKRYISELISTWPAIGETMKRLGWVQRETAQDIAIALAQLRPEQIIQLWREYALETLYRFRAEDIERIVSMIREIYPQFAEKYAQALEGLPEAVRQRFQQVRQEYEGLRKQLRVIGQNIERMLAQAYVEGIITPAQMPPEVVGLFPKFLRPWIEQGMAWTDVYRRYVEEMRSRLQKAAGLVMAELSPEEISRVSLFGLRNYGKVVDLLTSDVFEPMRKDLEKAINESKSVGELFERLGYSLATGAFRPPITAQELAERVLHNWYAPEVVRNAEKLVQLYDQYRALIREANIRLTNIRPEFLLLAEQIRKTGVPFRRIERVRTGPFQRQVISRLLRGQTQTNVEAVTTIVRESLEFVRRVRERMRVGEKVPKDIMRAVGELMPGSKLYEALLEMERERTIRFRKLATTWRRRVEQGQYIRTAEMLELLQFPVVAGRKPFWFVRGEGEEKQLIQVQRAWISPAQLLSQLPLRNIMAISRDIRRLHQTYQEIVGSASKATVANEEFMQGLEQLSPILQPTEERFRRIRDAIEGVRNVIEGIPRRFPFLRGIGTSIRGIITDLKDFEKIVNRIQWGIVMVEMSMFGLVFSSQMFVEGVYGRFEMWARQLGNIDQTLQEIFTSMVLLSMYGVDIGDWINVEDIVKAGLFLKGLLGAISMAPILSFAGLFSDALDPSQKLRDTVQEMLDTWKEFWDWLFRSVIGVEGLKAFFEGVKDAIKGIKDGLEKVFGLLKSMGINSKDIMYAFGKLVVYVGMLGPLVFGLMFSLTAIATVLASIGFGGRLGRFGLVGLAGLTGGLLIGHATGISSPVWDAIIGIALTGLLSGGGRKIWDWLRRRRGGRPPISAPTRLEELAIRYSEGLAREGRFSRLFSRRRLGLLALGGTLAGVAAAVPEARAPIAGLGLVAGLGWLLRGRLRPPLLRGRIGPPRLRGIGAGIGALIASELLYQIGTQLGGEHVGTLLSFAPLVVPKSVGLERMGSIMRRIPISRGGLLVTVGAILGGAMLSTHDREANQHLSDILDMLDFLRLITDLIKRIVDSISFLRPPIFGPTIVPTEKPAERPTERPVEVPIEKPKPTEVPVTSVPTTFPIEIPAPFPEPQPVPAPTEEPFKLPSLPKPDWRKIISGLLGALTGAGITYGAIRWILRGIPSPAGAALTAISFIPEMASIISDYFNIPTGIMPIGTALGAPITTPITIPVLPPEEVGITPVNLPPPPTQVDFMPVIWEPTETQTPTPQELQEMELRKAIYQPTSLHQNVNINVSNVSTELDLGKIVDMVTNGLKNLFGWLG